MAKNRTQESEIASDGLLATDELYLALSSRHRRRVMAYLLGVETSSVDELAALLCGWELAETVLVTPDRRRAFVNQLYHTYLPLLDDAGLVQYDSGTEQVSVEPLEKPVRDLILRAIEAEQQ